MANSEFREQIEDIKGLLSLENKALAYSKLLSFQQSSAENSSVQLLADSIEAILSFIVVDISDFDEEIAAPALKCLGFLIYHPCTLSSIKGDHVNAIIESLAKVITTAKIKSICNLGVWCISIQQFSESVLAYNFQPLLRAVIHALDNPMGSLSTRFEAMQAVVKLSSSLTEKMREVSNVWAPSIYRRLVSVDKRDRDMSERCLLKIRSIISPPPLTLCKVLVLDLKRNLLSAMKELMNQGMRIQTLQAWGWFIRLLGPYAMRNKHLVNEMLKLLEHTFSDFDSPVQIASLVAWEGLIDAFILPQIPYQTDFALEHETLALRTSEGSGKQMDANGHLKTIKLIMKPLIGIMSSKCDASVHASCLNTWSYLLHKLNNYISCQSVMKIVWEPIIEVIFQVGPENKNIWSFNFCVDLLDALILGRNKDESSNMNIQETVKLSFQNPEVGHLSTGRFLLKCYPLKWSPWDLSQLDFFTKMVYILATSGSKVTVSPEFRRLAGDVALRLFKSLLKEVNISLKNVSITYDEVVQCLNTLLSFLTKLCENVTSEDSCISDSCHNCLQFLEVTSEGLESSILQSSLYKVAFDVKCIEKLKADLVISSVTLEGMSIDSADMVSPVVYFSTLYFYVVVHSTLKAPESETILLQMKGYVKFLLTLVGPQEVLNSFIGLLYKHKMFNCLKIWVVLANCLNDWMDDGTYLLVLNMELEDRGYSLVLHFLSYPFALCSFPQIKLDLHDIMGLWKLLFVSFERSLCSEVSPLKNLTEDLCSILNGLFDEDAQALCDVENEGFLLLYESVIIYFLEQSTLSINFKGSKHLDDVGRICSNVKNIMNLTARFLKLLLVKKESAALTKLSLPSKFLSVLTHFVSSLHLREDVIVLIEAMSSPLVDWLSGMDLCDANTNNQLQLLWKEILKSLCQCQPLVKFDSSFLKFQNCLLARTLEHSNPCISEPTINFWNSTYGEQVKLEYPQNLVTVLDKLSRNGKINLCRRSHFREESNTAAEKFRTSPLNRCSKRVQIMKNVINVQCSERSLSSKRKRPELTEHQKEVRQAQQGRMMDCSGHGPGIRTYTSVDFSQGNEESQET